MRLQDGLTELQPQQRGGPQFVQEREDPGLGLQTGESRPQTEVSLQHRLSPPHLREAGLETGTGGLQDGVVILQATPGVRGVQLALQQEGSSVAVGVASIGQQAPPVCILERAHWCCW